MPGIGTERGNLQPAGDARFSCPGGKRSWRVMMHAFERLRVAAHDADGVHYCILPVKTGACGAFIQRAQVKFAVGGRLHLMPALAQAGGDVATDEAAAAEEEDVHGLLRGGRWQVPLAQVACGRSQRERR